MKTVGIISMAAAAGLIVGCASNQYTTTPTPPNGTSVDMSRNTDGTAGNSAYNFNQGTYSPPGSPGNEVKSELSLDQLPQAAQTTIRNQIGNESIAKIKQETKDGQTAYRVELQRQDWYGARPSLLVAEDGAILKESHMQKINEAAGAEAPQSSSSASSDYSGSSLGATGVEHDPAAPANPASPSPAYPPSSVPDR
jgi:hypothetical protein